MMWSVAIGAGFLLGLVHFSGLWLTVRRVVVPAFDGRNNVGRHRARPSASLATSRLIRLLLIGGGFVWLAQHGAISVLWGLLGWWCARGFVMFRVQRGCHAHE